MTEIPNFLKSGEVARLIPVIADSRREQRITSVFLSTLTAVPNLAQVLLQSVHQRVGSRATIDTYTEVVFANQTNAKDRPDGLIHLKAGRREWTALVEAKIGNARLDPDQVERYLQLAKENNLQAVITISNQFVARPDHHPIHVSKNLTKRVELFHWSWAYIFTEAMMLQRSAAISDPDQAFLLREFIRFLSHESAGLKGFDQMPPEWRDVVTSVQHGASLKRTSPDVDAVVCAWHQEARDLELQLSHHLAVNVATKLTRTQSASPDQRLKESCAMLVDDQVLTTELVVPNAASPISVIADLKSRNIKVGMRVDAPQDRKRALARVNWLLRQLSRCELEGVFVKLLWPTRANDTICSLHELRTDPNPFLEDGKDHPPRAFEIFQVSDSARRFSGRSTFIEDLEVAVPQFYDNVGQHLRSWQPKPPKPATKDGLKTKDDQGEVVQEQAEPPVIESQTTRAKIEPGNRHSFLLEIPSFLRRN